MELINHKNDEPYANLYHPTHQQQSDFLILVLYDFIVQNILSSLLLLCYNLILRI